MVHKDFLDIEIVDAECDDYSNIFDIFGNYHHPITRIVGGDNEKSEGIFSKPQQIEGSQNKDTETTTVISVTSPSLTASEVVKYSIYDNKAVRKYKSM